MRPGLSQRPERARGFTLLEILLVVTIIGIMAGLAMLSISGGESRHLQREVERLQQLLNLAQDEASWRQYQIGLRLTDSGYLFFRLDRAAQHWVEMTTAPFRAHTYELPLVVELQLEGSSLQLGSNEKREMPHLIFLSSGESSAFTLSMALPDTLNSTRTLIGDGFSPTRQEVLRNEG